MTRPPLPPACSLANGAGHLGLFIVATRRHGGGLVFGALSHSVRVMLKPLAGETLAQYLERVPRDRPEPA